MSRVAVCCASYNMARFLPELLKSLGEQTYHDFTLYVSYHGSTDDTEELLRDYQNCWFPIRLVPYKPEPGVGLNKHDVVEFALNDYYPAFIQMVDADDTLAPTFLEANVDRLEQGDVDWCLTWGRLFGDREGYIHSEIVPVEELLKRNTLHSWGCFKADVLRKHNFDPSLTGGEDWDLWIRLAQEGYQGAIIEEELYFKRWHAGNLTTANAGQPAISHKRDRTGYRMHLISLAHLPQSAEFMSCAFTQKNRKMAKMMTDLGHEVIFYGPEGSDVEEYAGCQFVQTHTLTDIARDYGDGDNRFAVGYDWTNTDFRHDFNSARNPSTQKFYQSCIDHINRIKRPDDFLLLSQGVYHRPIEDAVGLFLNCEFGIGYRGSLRRDNHFRAFESSYIQNFTYGSEFPYECINGSYYDRVIPNYFDPADFTFSAEKGDYYLFIGRMIKRKGILTADLACRHLGARLVIVGQGAHVDGRGRLIPNEDPDFVLEPGTWEYHGFANVEERKELMAHAIATFTPTEYLECFAGTHVESMLSGTPPITTNFAVFPGTIPDCVNGRVGFRCNTLQDFVDAAIAARKVDHYEVRRYGERFLMGNVALEFDQWFRDLYAVYESAVDETVRGWSRVQPLTWDMDPDNITPKGEPNA